MVMDKKGTFESENTGVRKGNRLARARPNHAPIATIEMVSETLIIPKTMVSESAAVKSMEVESAAPAPPGFPKASFKDIVQDQLRLLRAPWSKTLMGKVLGTTVRYDVLSQRLALLGKPHGLIRYLLVTVWIALPLSPMNMFKLEENANGHGAAATD
ncbi:hypothetical protein Cgig2_008562 [Carnegiea gigantea]|uniref:Uncharacterized protein n=1 Tax=Carnegiea gigantea TaxID=171969 RepID=A0A9Q1JRE1_9CARY|nr:hypothetical protein Cgig2_008562 [Carnegiea gigantea]